jgi:lipopolysaccharide export system protein LptA
MLFWPLNRLLLKATSAHPFRWQKDVANPSRHNPSRHHLSRQNLARHQLSHWQLRHWQLRHWPTGAARFALIGALSCTLPLLVQGLLPVFLSDAQAQSSGQSGGAIQMKASRVEANSNTGVVTAIGNVRIDYPSRQIYATSAQAQYYSREQRIVLNGNVDVLQEGNSLKAETVTYLIEEGRFVATPGADAQVEAVYILPESPAAEPNVGEATQAPPPVSLPTVPDDLPAELGPIEGSNGL